MKGTPVSFTCTLRFLRVAHVEPAAPILYRPLTSRAHDEWRSRKGTTGSGRVPRPLCGGLSAQREKPLDNGRFGASQSKGGKDPCQCPPLSPSTTAHAVRYVARATDTHHGEVLDTTAEGEKSSPRLIRALFPWPHINHPSPANSPGPFLIAGKWGINPVGKG